MDMHLIYHRHLVIVVSTCVHAPPSAGNRSAPYFFPVAREVILFPRFPTIMEMLPLHAPATLKWGFAAPAAGLECGRHGQTAGAGFL